MALALSHFFLFPARRVGKALVVFPDPPPYTYTIFLSVSGRDRRFVLLSHLVYDVTPWSG
jgi:hypothetical protein